MDLEMQFWLLWLVLTDLMLLWFVVGMEREKDICRPVPVELNFSKAEVHNIIDEILRAKSLVILKGQIRKAYPERGKKPTTCQPK